MATVTGNAARGKVPTDVVKGRINFGQPITSHPGSGELKPKIQYFPNCPPKQCRLYG